jgi:hypothetical protein
MLAVSHPAASTPRPAQGVRRRQAGSQSARLRLCLGRLAGSRSIRILSRAPVNWQMVSILGNAFAPSHQNPRIVAKLGLRW